MIVNIFSVIREGSQGPFSPARKTMLNLSRLSGGTAVTNYTTQLLFNGTLLATPPLGILVEGGFETIINSMAGSTDTNAVFTLTPDEINGVANTSPRLIKAGNIVKAWEDGGDVILRVLSETNYLVPFDYTFSTTTLEAMMVLLNNISDNIAFTGLLTTCTISTQTFTYNVNQAATLVLQKQTGEAWLPISRGSGTDGGTAVSAGSGSVVFTFDVGDLVLDSLMRVVAITADGQIHNISSKQYTCTGGSASGSGTPGDCTEYAYFDGHKWNDTTKEINIGATCSEGYNLQISTSPDFSEDKIVFDIDTESTIVQLLDITAGTYYARVKNLGGVTAYSSVLTFVAT